MTTRDELLQAYEVIARSRRDDPLIVSRKLFDVMKKHGLVEKARDDRRMLVMAVVETSATEVSK
jgi:hypothetical protein